LRYNGDELHYWLKQDLIQRVKVIILNRVQSVLMNSYINEEKGIMKRYGFIVCLLTLFMIFNISTVSANTVDRGQLLYENHCGGCHDSKAHLRGERLVENLVDLSKQVIRWQYAQKLDWQYDEVIQVMRYLNKEFYQFSLPSQ